MLLRAFKRHQDIPYFLFRLLIGFLFFSHGMQKLFGVFGGNQQAFFSLMGLAGIIEFLAGIAIMLGFFTRLAAFISIFEMLGAYFKAHAFNALLPIMNKGELALLYLAAFLILLAYGAKRWSLEKAILGREIF